jgi:hypothetical protein
LFLLAAGAATACADEARPIDPFVGTFVGQSVADPDQEITPRDIRVAIERTEEGFAIEWETAIPEGDSIERHQSRIEFLPTRRDNIYIAGQRRDRFGGVRPLNPIQGDPYFWASIQGDTLVVHGVHVTDDGGYELQTYERTLTESGMTLHFKRERNGEVVRDIRGVLSREE